VVTSKLQVVQVWVPITTVGGPTQVSQSELVVLVVVVVLELELELVVVVLVGGIVVVLVVVDVLVELELVEVVLLLVELVVLVVQESVSITTIFGDTLRPINVCIQTLDVPSNNIVSGCPVSQLPIKNDSTEVAVLYNIYD
jgi:hypothetical protein